MMQEEEELYSELDEILNHQDHYVEAEIGEVLFALKGELQDE